MNNELNRFVLIQQSNFESFLKYTFVCLGNAKLNNGKSNGKMEIGSYLEYSTIFLFFYLNLYSLFDNIKIVQNKRYIKKY